ncbi:MAG: HAMP domain-containing histidine kinase [Oscillospiraceae bacterium]|nr:HAMP domain-containing histidine kinase [Oscillospiraceae bacterium]
MKTSFSRAFYPAVLILLIALSSVGFLFQALTKNEIEDQAMERLKLNAQTVSELAAAYYDQGVTSLESFYLNMEVAARISEADTVICDSRGVLVLCSDAPLGCSHQGLSIESGYLQKVISQGCVMNTGVIRGLYEETRHVVSVPVLDAQKNAVGIVIASSPVDESVGALQAMGRIHLSLSIAVIVLSAGVMILVARRHSRPLGQLSRAAVAFGHGNLDARVSVDPACPEEIQELALAFNNMADSLQKSEYRRQEFVANVSHELKTPMTTIAGFADGILDGTIPQERQTHYLQLISRETKRLSRLVRSMLDVSRLPESGGIPEEQKSRFDVMECAGQVLLSFEQKITAKNLDVQVQMPDYPVFTRAHQDHITQVLYNLFDNAVKFCPPEGQLGLKLRAAGSKVYVSVSNSGQTIPPEELPLMFDRFHKLDKSRSENRDGWGLGLYIVRALIDAHGENISVTSREGITEFTFTVPFVN